MNFIISGRNIDVTAALKERVESKLGKVSKFFDEDTDVNVTLSVEKNRQIVEVTIPFKGMIFRAEQENADMYASIDKVIDVLERQIMKNKTRLERKFKEESLRFESLSQEVGNDNEDNRVIKTKRYALKPMLEEEAILQMNMLGHEFFMFRNGESNEVNLVYKRKDGHYGLIEVAEKM